MVFNRKQTEAKKSSAGTKPNTEAVAKRAYEKFLKRGGQHGSDLQDWYEAEQELTAKSGRGWN